MTLVHWIEAAVVVAIWIASPIIFFKNDLKRRFRTRDQRRRKAAEAARRKAEDEQRIRDDLAARYPVPTAQRAPESSG